MKIKAAIMGLVIVAFAVSGTSSFAQAKKPNIIIIWEDDIGQSNISAYSHGLMGYRTPNIDRVAREGVIGIEHNVDGAIRTSVRDYGVGIPEEARARVFDHFFTTKAKGLGMGLAIVRSIVESHGGTIAAENVDGGGRDFILFFQLTARVQNDPVK